MKKRNIINMFFGLCAVFFFTSCPNPTPDGPTLSVSPNSITLEANGMATIMVNSNTRWDVSTGGANWLKCSPSGDTGSKEVLVSITIPNTTGASRSAILTFTDRTGEKSVTVSVTEKSDPTPKIEVSPESLNFYDNAGSQTFVVTTNVSSWTAKSSDESWCTLSTSNNVVTVNVTANPNTSSRNAIITVSGGSAPSKTVTVSQTGKGEDAPLFEEPYLIWGSTVNSVKSFMSGYTAFYDGEVKNIAGVWTLAYQGKNNEQEIHYLFSTRTEGLYCSSLFFNASKFVKDDFSKAFNEMGYSYSHTNDGGYQIYKVKDGTSYVTYYPSDAFWIVEYFTPNIAFNLTVSPETLAFKASGGTSSFNIKSNDSWTITSSESWCSVSPAQSSNDSKISVTVSENTNTSSRTATITVRGNNSGIIRTVKVTQDPAVTQVTNVGRDEYGSDKNLDGSGSVTYTLSLNVSSLSTSPAGESKTVNVTSNDSWTVSSNQSWCTVSPSSGSNNGTVKITTAKNTTSSSRTATVTIKGTNSGKTITVTVSQNTYTLSVSPTSLSTSAAGETKNVNVTSNDSWTVSSNQSWCTVSPSSGSNNGTVKITTAKNTTSSSRTATVTIKGTNSGKSVTVKVTQDAGTNVGRDEYDSDKNLDGSGSFTLSVSTSSLQMKAQGESKTVSVSSNDSWTVTSNQSWCTITPSSGTNNGSLKITSSKNTSSSRTATVTIKGKNSSKSATVKVTQDPGDNIGRDEYGNDKQLK